MKKNYLNHQFYALALFALLTLTGCVQKSEENKIDFAPTINSKEKGPKELEDNESGRHKKGIEIMADYIASIMKPIGAEKSTYEEGYLMTEFKKAKSRSSFKSSSSKAPENVVWTERGPANIPGRIRNVVVSPANPDKWYAGSVGGGLWVTEDAGNTWRSLTDFKIPNLSTSTVAVSTSNTGTIYLGTGEPYGNLDALGGTGVLKSSDDGLTWQYLANTSNFGDIGRLALNPNDEDNLIVASELGIFITTDGGLSWQQTYNAGNVQDLNYDPSNFNTLYAGVNQIGVIKSTDGGLTWSIVLNRLDFNPNHARFELDVSPVNTNKIIVGVYTPNENATTAVNTDFYVSNDAGDTFSVLGFLGNKDSANIIGGQGWYDNIITAHPFNENVFYAGGVTMYRVEIGFIQNYTFKAIAAGYNGQLNDYVHVDQHGLTYNTDASGNIRLILSNDGGVYHTDYKADPGTTLNDWSDISIGLNSTQFYGADKANGTDDFIVGAQDNGTAFSLDGNAGKTTLYTPAIGGDGFEVVWNYNNPNLLIGGSQFNNFVRFNLGTGESFNAAHPDAGEAGSPFYSKITNANNNPDVLFSPSVNGVWKSTDFGETWKLTSIPTSFSAEGSSAKDVAVSIAQPDYIWAGDAMTETGSFAIHLSVDNGESYNTTAPFIDPRPEYQHNYYISGIETSHINANRAYVLFSGQGAAKIIKTDDLGQSWEDISGFSIGEDRGFPDVAIHSLIEMPFDENVIWVGTDLGVFETVDGGLNWSLLEGLPAVSVWQMKIVNDEIVMATHGRGVWTATLEELSNYELPAYFGAPQVTDTYQESIDNTNGIVVYNVVDENVASLKLFLDDTEVAEITSDITFNTPSTFKLENLEEGIHTFGIQAISTEGQTSVIAKKNIAIVDFAPSTDLLKIDSFETQDVFTFNGQFVIDDIGGTLTQSALNNLDHPYNNSSTYTTILKTPISITEGSANFSYEDVAITEPGPANGFYDYVTIEASTDLRTWERLDIYDARRFTEWQEVYNASDNGSTQTEGQPNAAINDDLFRSQTINLLDTFEAGQTIAIRFRLVSDNIYNSFGWAIRSINADQSLSAEDNLVTVAGLKIYPTVSDGNIFISSQKEMLNSTLNLYNINGQVVYSKKLDIYPNEQNLVLGELSNGMYFLNIESDLGSTNQKILIK